MSYIHRCMIVPAEYSELARSIAEGLEPVAAVGMWTTPLSPSGQEPPTHFVSTGMIAVEFAPLLASANLLHQACQAAQLPASLEDCHALVGACDVSEDQPFDAFARAGLAIIDENNWDDTPYA